jgi:predicted PurR-regulated permease PerM
MSIFKLELSYKNLMMIAAAVLVLSLLYRIQSIISIFAVSFFIAYLLDPLIDRIEKLKIPRVLGILILITLLSVILALFFIALFPLLYSEVNYLISSVPKVVASLTDTAQHMAERLNIDITLDNLKNQLAPTAGEIAKQTLNAVEGLLSSATTAVSGVINLAIVPILVFYFLKDFDRLNNKLYDIIGRKEDGEKLTRYLKEFDTILSVYFRGQVIVAAILAVLYTSVLLIVGVKPAVLIGLVSGILSIVPYLGFIIGFGSSLILAVVQYQDILHPLMVVAGFAIVQAIEGNIITPKIVGESLGLHPTAVIFALLAGGSLFGIGGMIIALPIAAFIKILIKEQIA